MYVFTLTIQSANGRTLTLRMGDVWGRMVENKTGIAPNSTLRIGASYKPGVYFAQLLQGDKK